MRTTSPRPASVFVSYSWDNEAHCRWVRRLAQSLRNRGVATVLDQWHAVPGDQLGRFMEGAIRKSKFVLIICTPRYRQRSETHSGVRYEGDIMRGELLQKGNQRKFIPVLRRGTWARAAPWWLAGKYYIDLRDGPRKRSEYAHLVAVLKGALPQPPPVGHPATRVASSARTALTTIIANGAHGGAKHDELRVLWSVHASGKRGTTHERVHESVFGGDSSSTTRVLRALSGLLARNLVQSSTHGGATVYRLTKAAEQALDAVASRRTAS